MWQENRGREEKEEDENTLSILYALKSNSLVIGDDHMCMTKQSEHFVKVSLYLMKRHCEQHKFRNT